MPKQDNVSPRYVKTQHKHYAIGSCYENLPDFCLKRLANLCIYYNGKPCFPLYRFIFDFKDTSFPPIYLKNYYFSVLIPYFFIFS